MTNYKEILRLHSLGINNTRIAESCGCARSTVIPCHIQPQSYHCKLRRHQADNAPQKS